MTNLLSRVFPEANSRKLPEYVKGDFLLRIPYQTLHELRAYHDTIDKNKCFSILDNIGIDAIADLISQGAYIYDVSETLGIPITFIYDWIESDDNRHTKISKAESYSADAAVSIATREIMGLDYTDTERAKIAKIKADHMKWVASRRNREKFGDGASKSTEDGGHFQFNIVLQNNQQNN